jgi:aryl-alcohol dehydrogenase-like predicted oxidoreductase
MEMRMFGRTGLELSVLGFGCGAVGERCSQSGHYRANFRADGEGTHHAHFRPRHWLSDRLAFCAAPMAVAETATIQAVTSDGTQSPSQPTPEEDLLNLED